MSSENTPNINVRAKLKQLPQAGLSFSRISTTRLMEWIGMALVAQQNHLMVFADATTVSRCSQDADLFAVLQNADLLIPRGRGLNLGLNLLGEHQAPTLDSTLLYDHILLELEHRGKPIAILCRDDAQATKMLSQLAARYPHLKSTVHTLAQPQDCDWTKLTDTLADSGAQALIVALESPAQELALRHLGWRLRLPLTIAMGLPLFAALEELTSSAGKFNTLLRKLSRKRWSVAIRPLSYLRFLWSAAKFKLWRDEQLNTSLRGVNDVLRSSNNQARLVRLQIAIRSYIWKLRCRMQRSLKRAIDIAGASVGLLMLSPLLIPVMLIIKATSPGPLFYSQIRVGYRGKTFRMWKFRSMYIDADARKAALEAQNEMAGGVIFKMKNDPRITPIGRLIRRLSIDELPQLYNVLSGEMSLVGPRPALESEVAQYPVLARARLEAIPGLTGLWQISGRSDLPFDKQILLDTTYVHTQSASNDIKLIAKTIPAVLSGKGAY